LIIQQIFTGIVPALIISSSKSLYDLIELSMQACGYLFWLGVRSQQIYDRSNSNEYNKENMNNSMMSIANIRIDQLHNVITQYNLQCESSNQHAYISIKNGASSYVVSGSFHALMNIQQLLQNTINNISCKLLNVHCPYHCILIKDCMELILDDAQRIGFELNRNKLQFPVLSTYDGSNLQKGNICLLRQLISLQCVDFVDWYTVCLQFACVAKQYNKNCTVILDFGVSGFPKYVGGIAVLTAKNLDIDENINIVACNSCEVPIHIERQYKIFDRNILYTNLEQLQTSIDVQKLHELNINDKKSINSNTNQSILQSQTENINSLLIIPVIATVYYAIPYELLIQGSNNTKKQ